MFVKLVHPNTGETLTLQASGEVMSSQTKEPYTEAQLQEAKQLEESTGADVRHFVLWHVEADSTWTANPSIIRLTVNRRSTVIFTNWNAWLCNDNGRTIDTIHRYKD